MRSRELGVSAFEIVKSGVKAWLLFSERGQRLTAPGAAPGEPGPRDATYPARFALGDRRFAPKSAPALCPDC